MVSPDLRVSKEERTRAKSRIHTLLEPDSSAQAMDPWIVCAALALACLGLVMVYSSSAWIAQAKYQSWEYYGHRQSVFFMMGVAVMFGISRIDYRIFRRLSPIMMLVSIVLLLSVLWFGREINGAKRWLAVGGVGFQPSELAKLALTCFLATMLAQRGEQVRSFIRGFLPITGASAITMGLVIWGRDLGTTVLLGALTLIMMFVAGTRVSFLVATVLGGILLLWWGIIHVQYRLDRLLDFFANGEYQVNQGLIAIGSGGMWGLGLGQGRQKLGFLPENHTDFIFATLGEELGYAGILLVLGLYCLLIWRGALAAYAASDRFGAYLACGITMMIALQALFNMAVVLRMVPTKGITLPFLSSGGSSLLSALMSVGILLAISRNPALNPCSDPRGRTPRWQWPGVRNSQWWKKMTEPRTANKKNRRRAHEFD